MRFLQRAGDATNQAAAANRNDHGLEIRVLFEKLEANRALTGDDGVVIESMHESEALSLAAAQRLFVSFVVIRAMQHHIGAITSRCRDFDEGSRQRHANLRADSKLAGVVSNALGVIS